MSEEPSLEKVRLSIRMQRLVELRGLIYTTFRSDDVNDRRFARYEDVDAAIHDMRKQVSPRWWPTSERLLRAMDVLTEAWGIAVSRKETTRALVLDERYNLVEDALYRYWDER
jgi:hypothetical protein